MVSALLFVLIPRFLNIYFNLLGINPEYGIYLHGNLVTSRVFCADLEQATGIQSAGLALYRTVIKCIWLLRLARDQCGRTVCTSQNQGRPALLTIPCTLNNQQFLQAILSFDLHVSSIPAHEFHVATYTAS